MQRKRLNQAKFVERGYGQVEPNHLSVQLNGQIYAQLPADANINVLENGQFAKYDYKNGVVDFAADNAGEWMLVFNEVKVYRDFEGDADFAMLKDDYTASIYSPLGETGKFYKPLNYKSIAKNPDPYEWDSTNDPFNRELKYKAKPMPEGTVMVPRLLGTHVGDIFTTNMVATGDNVTYAKGEILKLKKTDRNTLELTKDGDIDTIAFAIVKVYTMPDGQPGLKVQRVK